MDSSREYKYSVLKLIEAVKVRPLLWDSSVAEFRSHKNKDKVWQDVFEELDDNYRFLSAKERSVIALKITTKWRNIRDVFIRSVKKRATDTKMKKYMYHDRLSFMLKLYKSYIRPESPGSDQFDKPYNNYIKSLYENKAQRSISFDNVPENSLDEKPKTSTSVEEELFSLKTEPDDDNNDEEELTNDGLEGCSSSKNIVRVADFDDDLERTSCSENQAVESENESIHHHQNHQENKPIERGLNQSSSGRNIENVVILQSNEDEAFFTSILSSLRDMSLDEKLEFRIGVLQKISDIRSKRHNS